MCASHHSISLTTPRTDETLQPADPLATSLATPRSISQPLAAPFESSRNLSCPKVGPSDVATQTLEGQAHHITPLETLRADEA